MKLIHYMLAAAAVAGALSLGSCSGSSKDAAKDAADSSAVAATEQAQAASADNPYTSDSVAIGVQDLTDDSIIRPDMKVLRPLALDFNATWCGPCKAFHPAFEAAAEKFAGEINFVTLDIDQNPETAKAFGVESIPTIVIMAPGQATQTFVGTEKLLPQERFFDILQKTLDNAPKQ